MPVDRDPAEIIATLRRSIEASQRGSRRLRAHRFKDLFGFQAWSPARREMVAKPPDSEGIVVQPSLQEAGRDDWLVFSMPTLPEVRQERAEPRPSDAWFAHLEQLHPGSEREVEMHFAAPPGLGLHTPADVHYGHAQAVRAARAGVLAAAYAAHPNRFVRQLPQPPKLPAASWINPPQKEPAQ